MQPLPVRALAVAAYACFLAVFGYFALFVGDLVVPRTLDSGPVATPAVAIAIDLALVAAFGVVHSVMARAGFKRVWTRVVPPAAERSVYVLVASAQIALLCWQWRPITSEPLWVTGGAAAAALRAVQALGWATVLVSSFLIDHFEMFGLRQAFRGPSTAPVALRTPLLYRWVRHPLYLGLLIGLWSAPTMTASHLLFATLFTAYLLIGVRHEERDLVRTFGDAYRRYQAEVPMLLPVPRLR